MVDSIERRPEAPPPPEGVVERPAEIPERVERGEPSATTQPAPATTQPASDSGQKPAPTSSANQIVIQIPTDTAKLDDLSKGEPTNAITWLAMFFLRVLKKAKHFGWKIIQGGS